MNGNYKKMMAQHGGYIPFSVLGKQGNQSNSSKSNSSKRTSRVRKNTGKMKTNENRDYPIKYNQICCRYYYKKNNQLVMLSNQRQWQPVKFT